eukprot:scaffold77260_cov48-Phaeocystis_antarctica.AAC.2
MLLFELGTMHFLTEDLHGNIRELTGNGYDRCRRTFSTFQQFAIALQLCSWQSRRPPRHGSLRSRPEYAGALLYSPRASVRARGG